MLKLEGEAARRAYAVPNMASLHTHTYTPLSTNTVNHKTPIFEKNVQFSSKKALNLQS